MRSLATFQSFLHTSKGLCNLASRQQEPEQSCSGRRPVQVCLLLDMQLP